LRSKIVAVVSAAIGLACASSQKAKLNQASAPVASNDQTKEKKHVVCDFEVRVGTHLREEVCRYQEDIDEERAEAQRLIQRQRIQDKTSN
jgi:hypothetical protein